MFNSKIFCTFPIKCIKCKKKNPVEFKCLQMNEPGTEQFAILKS